MDRTITTPIALLRAGEADQVAFGIAEVANTQASPGPTLGAHQALPSEALGLFERGSNIRNLNVKESMALIARASADATGNACPVTGRVAVHKAVISSLRNSLRDRAARVELPSEKIVVVGSQTGWISPNDFKVQNWLPHRRPLQTLANLMMDSSSSHSSCV